MAINRYKDKKDDTIEKENVISLKHFPPRLRKLAKFLLQYDKQITIKQACEELNVNYGSVRTLISQEKKKGNDFNKFLEEVSENYLNLELINIDKATVNGALEGSARDRELYYKRINKLKEQTNVELNNSISLTYAVQVNSGTQTRPKGQNQLTPYIPTKK